MGIRDSMFGACVIHILYVLSVAWSADLVQHHGTSTCKGYHAKLTCPEDNRIAIRAILYGTHREYCDQRAHGMEHCCSSLVDDCIFSHKAAILSMNTYCSGLDSCIGSSHPTGEMPKHHCGFHLSYMKVNYDCVPKKVVAEFCTDSTYTDSSLYISSPAYPASMGAGNSSCSCVVTAGRTADVNISIQAIDILFTGVGYRPRICEQKLSIRSKKHPEPGNFSIDCNDQKMYGFREIYNSDGNRWLLTLNTHYASNRGRVWLLVKSVDSDHRLTVRCGPTMRWEEFESVHVPDMSESTRRYIGIGILAGLALAICGAIILVVTIVIWQCSRRRKSKKYDVKDKKKQSSSDYAPSGEKPLQNEDTGCGMCKTLPQHKPPNSKKERKSSKTYATVPRNLESRRYQEHDSMTTFPQSPTTSSQQEFLHDYSIPPPPAGPYENMCMNSATFPRGRPLVPDPYAQYYAAIQPRQPGPYDPLSHAPAVPTYSAGADDEEWPPPYVPEEMDMVENTLYESANYH